MATRKTTDNEMDNLENVTPTENWQDMQTELEMLREEKRRREEAERAAAEAEAKLKADPRRLVTVEVSSSKGDTYPLYVNVNDENFMLPRDKPVTVPYYVALSIQESLKQDKKTRAMIRMYEDDYRRRSAAAGL